METDSVFCISCGTANRLNARFCYKCGAPVIAQASAPTAETPPPARGVSPLVPVNTPVPMPPSMNATPGSDFITLACPSCGGKLNITSSLERFACGHCGNEHIVRRAGGTVSLEPVMDKLNQISDNINSMGGGISRITAVAEKQAAEAAIKRLRGEIEEQKKRMATLEGNTATTWMIFGISAVVMALSIFVLILDGGETGILKAIFIPGALLGGLMTLIGLIAVISVTSSRKKEEQQIYASISQKEQELARNQQIANS